MTIKKSEIIKRENLSAFILAGGKNKRFGSPKLSARFNKKSLIEIILEAALKISDRISVIRGNEKINLPEHIESFQDILPDKGPLGGIHAALYYSQTQYVAILPVDMPLLCPDIYEILAGKIKNDHPVAARSTKGLEPLVSIWSKKSLKAIENYIKSEKLSIWRCMDELEATQVDITGLSPTISDKCFYNINTKADLERLQQILNLPDTYPDQALKK